MPLPGARKALAIVALAELLAKSLWFSGTAVIPQLSHEWHAGLSLTSWLTLTVQLGFVAGALLLAVTNLLDLTSAARIFAVSSLLGAAFTAAFAVVAARHIGLALFLRFLTGMTAAGVYPTGMKVLTGWYQRGRGLALGVVVGAITIGSALPHAVHIGSLPWRGVIYVCAGFSLVAGVLMLFGVEEGPHRSPAPRFDVRQVAEALRNRELRLANLGYLGHMWELYSMWGWITLLLAAAAPTLSHNALETISFFAIAVGAVGCVWAGYVSDRNQRRVPASARDGVVVDVRARSRVTIVAMAASGACCVLAAAFFHHFWMLTAIALVWGVSVVADSAQFSTITSEVADQRYVGTALTMQTAMGFLLTSVSIRLVAGVGSAYGWRWAALTMAAGPVVGIVAMLRLGRERGDTSARLPEEWVAEITSP
ncbi:MAG: MFS transporter [Terriglobales bacterium]